MAAAAAAPAATSLTRQSSSASVASWFDHDNTQLLVERVCDALCDLLTQCNGDPSVCDPFLKRFVSATAVGAAGGAAASDTKSAPAAGSAASAGADDDDEPDTAALTALDGDLDDALGQTMSDSDRPVPTTGAAAAAAAAVAAAAANPRQELSKRLVALGGAPLPDAYIAGPPATAAAAAAADADEKLLLAAATAAADTEVVGGDVAADDEHDSSGGNDDGSGAAGGGSDADDSNGEFGPVAAGPVGPPLPAAADAAGAGGGPPPPPVSGGESLPHPPPVAAGGAGGGARGPVGPPLPVVVLADKAADKGKTKVMEKHNKMRMRVTNKPQPPGTTAAAAPVPRAPPPPAASSSSSDGVSEVAAGLLLVPDDDDDAGGGGGIGLGRLGIIGHGAAGGGGTRSAAGGGTTNNKAPTRGGGGTSKRGGAAGAGGRTPSSAAAKGLTTKTTAAAAKPPGPTMPTGAVLTVQQQLTSASIRLARTKAPPVPQGGGWVKPQHAGVVYAWGLPESLGRGHQSGAADKKKTSAGVAPGPVLGTVQLLGGSVQFVQVSCGLHFTACVSSDGRVFAFGHNGKDHNRLGLGPTSADYYSVAQPVTFPAATSSAAGGGVPPPFIVRVACGTKHTVALAHNGACYSWGDDSTCRVLGRTTTDKEPASVPGRVSVVIDKVDTPVAHVSCGNRFTVCVTKPTGQAGAATSVGRVLAWGLNTSSQCGAPATTTAVREPTLVPALSGLNAAGVSFVSTGCGFSWAGAITSTGALYTWGNNADGQCGHGSAVNSKAAVVVVSVPTKVAALEAAGVRVVSFDGSRGEHHGSSMALSGDGALYAWGDNYKFKLGVGDDTARATPTRVADAPPGVAGLASGGIHAAAWTAATAAAAGAHAYAWGCGSDGRLGLPDITKRGHTARYLFKQKVPRSLHAPPMPTVAVIADVPLSSLASRAPAAAAAGAGGAAPAGAAEKSKLMSRSSSSSTEAAGGGGGGAQVMPFKHVQRAVWMAADYYHTVAIIADK